MDGHRVDARAAQVGVRARAAVERRGALQRQAVVLVAGGKVDRIARARVLDQPGVVDDDLGASGRPDGIAASPRLEPAARGGVVVDRDVGSGAAAGVDQDPCGRAAIGFDNAGRSDDDVFSRGVEGDGGAAPGLDDRVVEGQGAAAGRRRDRGSGLDQTAAEGDAAAVLDNDRRSARARALVPDSVVEAEVGSVLDLDDAAGPAAAVDVVAADGVAAVAAFVKDQRSLIVDSALDRAGGAGGCV